MHINIAYFTKFRESTSKSMIPWKKIPNLFSKKKKERKKRNSKPDPVQSRLDGIYNDIHIQAETKTGVSELVRKKHIPYTMKRFSFFLVFVLFFIASALGIFLFLNSSRFMTSFSSFFTTWSKIGSDLLNFPLQFLMMYFLFDRVLVSAKKEADVKELQIGVKVNCSNCIIWISDSFILFCSLDFV